VSASLSLREIARELADYEVALPDPELEKLSLYLELLQRWNRRINLTGLREPRAMVRRLFGESLYISRVVELRGRLVDVGSGAGFPGLALKLVAPDLQVTLVEARQRIRAASQIDQAIDFVRVDDALARLDDQARVCNARQSVQVLAAFEQCFGFAQQRQGDVRLIDVDRERPTTIGQRRRRW